MLSPLQKANIVLSRIYKRQSDVSFNLYDIKNMIIEEKLWLTSDESMVSHNEVREILDAYLQEGYLKIDNDYKAPTKWDIKYDTTFEGRVFISKGGYERTAVSDDYAEADIINRIPILIQEIPPYGEFELQMPQPKPNVDAIPFSINMPDEQFLNSIRNSITAHQKEYEENLKALQFDEAVVQYLVLEGFAINRHDIKATGKIYRQLTDEGRNLKKLGTLEKYRDVQRKLQEERDILWSRDRKMYLINFWIAVGAVATIVYYIFEILRTQYHLGLPHHINFN
jgi:hypothetical protein